MCPRFWPATPHGVETARCPAATHGWKGPTVGGMRLDVLVVGAGPAGVAAAITAHERGLRTLVVDKATFPRDKTCGDGLTAQALRLLERLGVDVRDLADAAIVRETVLVSPSGRAGRACRCRRPAPTPRSCRGVVLDAALVRHARSLGVDVCCGAALTDLRDDATACAPASATSTVEAQAPDRRRRSLVDGPAPAASPTRRPISAPGTPSASTSVASTTRANGCCSKRTCCRATRGRSPSPAGGPTSGSGCCAGPASRAAAQGAVGRPAHPARRCGASSAPAPSPEDPHRAWPIPATLREERLVDGRVLYAGDAAGVVDPMTGEGIAQALESGMLAATAVAEGGPPDRVAARYQHRIGRVLGRDLRFAATLQRVLRSPLGARGAIRAAGLTPWTRRNFGRWMFEDYPRALLLTPDRWHRHMLSPPRCTSAESLTRGASSSSPG